MNVYIDKSEEEEEEKIKLLANWTKSFEKCVTMDYNNLLKSSDFINEDELEDINIIYRNNKIQYCSIDLLLKKICEDNSFNIDIYINQENNNQTFNFINAFIYQCFAFISYELLILKILEMYKYYKVYNKLTKTKKKRLLLLIFKLTKYLYEHRKYGCSYFQFSDELENKIKNFLKDNNMKEQIKYFLEYKKAKLLESNDKNKNKYIKNNIKSYSKPNNEHESYGLFMAGSFINYPNGNFEFNILKYNERDIALVISYISIKNFNNFYNHLYELNPTIKKKETDKPHLLEIINFSNKLTNFLIEESFSYDLLNIRVNVVEKIIKILIELRNLNNFNDILSVCSALMSISMRLTKTWNMIDSKLKSKYNEINKFCCTLECYRYIQDEEKRCINNNIFYIPCVVITTKHITFYEETAKYIGHNGLVCVEKIIVNQKEIEQFRNELKPLREKNNIIKLKNTNDINELKIVFYNMDPKDLDTLDKLSQKLEPEFTLYKVPDTRKRRTKTDQILNNVK